PPAAITINSQMPRQFFRTARVAITAQVRRARVTANARAGRAIISPRNRRGSFMIAVLSKQPLARWALVGVVVVAVGSTVVAWRQLSDPGDPTDPSAPTDPPAKEPDAGGAAVRLHKPAAVAANRSADVPDGFRGAVHPMLHGRTPLEVTADWTPLRKDQLKLQVPESILAWYTALRPAAPRRTYAAPDFSAFLPA